jgi:hypothetical protein
MLLKCEPRRLRRIFRLIKRFFFTAVSNGVAEGKGEKSTATKLISCDHREWCVGSRFKALAQRIRPESSQHQAIPRHFTTQLQIHHIQVAILWRLQLLVQPCCNSAPFALLLCSRCRWGVRMRRDGGNDHVR